METNRMRERRGGSEKDGVRFVQKKMNKMKLMKLELHSSLKNEISF